MKKIFSRIMAAAAALTASVGLSACGSHDRASDTLVVWWPGASSELAAIRRAAELYEEETGIKLSVVPQAEDNFFTTYALSLSTDEYPDVALVDHIYVQQLAYGMNGTSDIVDFSETLGESVMEETAKRYVASLAEPNCYKGRWYSLPFSVNCFAMAYNKTLLARVYGIEVSELNEEHIPDTLEEMIAFCGLVNEYNQAHGTSLYAFQVPCGNTADFISVASMTYISMTKRYGGSVMNDDLTKVTIYNDDFPSDKNANVNAVKALYALSTTNAVPGNGQESNFFDNDRTVFIETGCWKVDDLEFREQQKGTQFGWTELISMTEGGDKSPCLGMYSLIATEKSPNKKAAAEFCRWLSVNDEVQLLYNKPAYTMAVTKSALEDEFYDTAAWQVFKSSLGEAVARPGTPKWDSMQNELGNFVTNILSGKYSSEENAVKELASQQSRLQAQVNKLF